MYLDPIITSPDLICLPKKGDMLYCFCPSGEITCHLVLNNEVKTVIANRRTDLFLVSGDKVIVSNSLMVVPTKILARFVYDFSGPGYIKNSVVADNQKTHTRHAFRSFHLTNDFLCMFADNTSRERNFWNLSFILAESHDKKLVKDINIGDGGNLQQIASVVYGCDN